MSDGSAWVRLGLWNKNHTYLIHWNPIFTYLFFRVLIGFNGLNRCFAPIRPITDPSGPITDPKQTYLPNKTRWFFCWICWICVSFFLFLEKNMCIFVENRWIVLLWKTFLWIESDQIPFKQLIKPKSVIRPYEDFLDYFLRSYGFYKMPFACF